MTDQTFLMIVIVVACGLSSLDWAMKGEYASAIAFAGFGAGYVGLAILFRSVT